MLESAKSMGVRAAKITLAGAAISIGNLFSSLIYSIYCIVCPNDGLSDLIYIMIQYTFS
ncbi:hypothetical protein AAG906_016767 [Vitis piasezkii]